MKNRRLIHALRKTGISVFQLHQLFSLQVRSGQTAAGRTGFLKVFWIQLNLRGLLRIFLMFLLSSSEKFGYMKSFCTFLQFFAFILERQIISFSVQRMGTF